MQDFKNLAVWHVARLLAKSIDEMTAVFPVSEQFGLSAQMRRASISFCSTIAEGCGRRGDLEFRRFLSIAMGSACELECDLDPVPGPVARREHGTRRATEDVNRSKAHAEWFHESTIGS